MGTLNLVQAMGTPSNARNRHDVSNRAHLERLRGERMKEADDLRAELASTRAALEEAVSRQQGAAARKKALEKEVRCIFYAQSAPLAKFWQ